VTEYREEHQAARMYRIKAEACDDETVVTLSLTADEAEVVCRVAEAITAASEVSCMPRMFVQLTEAVDGE
jgi:hypothetical protein